MQVQINYGDIDGSDALAEHVNSQLEKALTHVAHQITRVEVHLRDDKQKRHGPDDRRCTLEARLAGMQPMAVDARADDIYKAVTDAAAKLGRAVTRTVERRRDEKKSPDVES